MTAVHVPAYAAETRAGRVLWNALAPTFEHILVHPFVTGLTDGTLPREAFARYVEQNYRYLESFGRALALVAARGASGEDTEFFGQRAAYAIAAERSFNAELVDALGLDEPTVRSAEPGPTTLAYSSFVLSTVALGERVEGFGAVLPCYVVYGEVGAALVQRGSPDPHYQRWIDTYVDPGFEAGVRGALAAAERATAALADAALAPLAAAARVAARYEWLFWDAAWRGERWPELGGPAGAPEERVPAVVERQRERGAQPASGGIG